MFELYKNGELITTIESPEEFILKQCLYEGLDKFIKIYSFPKIEDFIEYVFDNSWCLEEACMDLIESVYEVKEC
jgi:hypothetical protein